MGRCRMTAQLYMCSSRSYRYPPQSVRVCVCNVTRVPLPLAVTPCRTPMPSHPLEEAESKVTRPPPPRVSTVVMCRGSPLVLMCQGSPLLLMCRGSPLVLMCRGSPLVVMCRGSPLLLMCRGSPLLLMCRGSPLLLMCQGSPLLLMCRRSPLVLMCRGSPLVVMCKTATANILVWPCTWLQVCSPSPGVQKRLSLTMVLCRTRAQSLVTSFCEFVQ